MPDEGITLGRQAVEIARQLGDLVLLADTLLSYAASVKTTDPDAAEAAYREGLVLVRRSGDVATATRCWQAAQRLSNILSKQTILLPQELTVP